MPTTVTWLWFGNHEQVNTNPATPATQAEVNTTIGYTAVGPDQIRAVDVAGVTRSVVVGGRVVQAFSATYNPATTSPMTYLSPSTGTTVTTQITGFASIRYELIFPDGSTVEQTGVGIQMANGDSFFRPSIDTVGDWDGIDALRGVRILSATPLPASTYIATVSFSADIHDLPITCFAAGTMVVTNLGERPVEDLSEGDMVWTRDNGMQPVRWHGARRIGAAELSRRANLRPIRISAGALGVNQPATDLVVSPQHRILVRSNIARRMFGTSELLVAAKQLLGLPGISVVEDAIGVTYVHLMLDRHEVIMSNGAETESLYPGPQAILALGKDAAEEIYTIFPELRDRPTEFPGARPFVSGSRARKLAARHIQNERPLAS